MKKRDFCKEFNNYKHWIYQEDRDGVMVTVVKSGTTYAGKTVYGYATCLPSDTFDEEFGKALADARCNKKVASLRLNRAYNQSDYYKNLANEFARLYNEKMEYVTDSMKAFDEATEKLDTLLKESN